MKSFVSLGCSLAIFQTLSAGAVIPRYFQTVPVTRRQLSSTRIQQELGGQVTNTTTIFGPDDSRYDDATSRWNNFAVPRVRVVIEPGEESDISTIVSTIGQCYIEGLELTVIQVQYCNENSIEFLTYNRGHGYPKSLGSFNGIQINLANLKNITIQPNGESAWFEGGAYDGEVSRYLWEQGYVTTTGACDCVGMMGPGLGGGHGRHEGLYGMISDNIRQLNIVLADGTSIRVNETSYPDLLWGMKGAGHNFGIVTSFEMNIFPRGPETWHYHNYMWRSDKIDDVFNALNAFHNNGSTPVNMAINFGLVYINSTITEEEPIIWWTFGYRGSAEEAEQLLVPFNAIETVYDEIGDIPYPQIADIQGTGEQGFLCQHNKIRISSTAGLQVYNLTAEHQIFDGFQQRIKENLELAKGGVIVHEGYSTEGVDTKNPDDSAYPFRDDHHLMLFNAIIAPNSGLEDAAWEWANEVAAQWNGGQPDRLPNAYVNYASGLEPVEQWYGHEPWRLERLRDLKAQYDPNNRFRFYNPIVQEYANGSQGRYKGKKESSR